MGRLVCMVVCFMGAASVHQVVYPTSYVTDQRSLNARNPPGPPMMDAFIGSTNPKGLSGYVPLSPPYTSPDDQDLTNFANAIPVASECTVRPQTIIEIEKVRKSAAQLAANIDIEGNNIAKRKAYIEAMSAYLNERIRDLNKVKNELAEELRWVEMTNEQINLLNAREKQMKLQDILACMNNDKRQMSGKTKEQAVMVAAMKKSSEEVLATMTAVQNNINAIQDGKAPQSGTAPTPAGGAAAGGAAGAGGAPPG